jgi:type IV secretory pathway VirB10-like protein
MAAGKKKKASTGRMMMVLGGAVTLAIAGGAIGIASFSGGEGAPTASAQPAPDAQGPATGEGADPRYRQLIEERNREAAERALAEGRSSALTLTDTATLQSCDEECAAKQAQLEAELNAAAQRERQLQQQLEAARRGAARQQNGSNQVTLEPFYIYEGREYMTAEYAAQQRENIRSDMVRLEQAWSLGRSATALTSVANTEPATRGSRGEADMVGRGTADGNETWTPPRLKAGAIKYATLDLMANSDVPGPIRATIHDASSEWNGATVLGAYTKMSDYLVMRFDKLVSEEGEMFAIDAIAIDPTERLGGVADEVDHHYLQRFGAIFAAAFLQGYGEAVLESRRVEVTGEQTTTVSNIESDSDRAIAALGEVGNQLAEVVRPLGDRPTTVIKYAGSGIGLLFLEEVTSQ